MYWLACAGLPQIVMLKGSSLGFIPGASGSPLTGSLAEPANAGIARASSEVTMRSKTDLVTAFRIVDILSCVDPVT
jgi:hypothetical protein